MGPPPGGHRRGVLVSAGVVIAIMLAIAALVVGVVALVHQPAAPPTAAPPPTTATQSALVNTEAADRALCQDIAPLMKEGDERANAFVNLGHHGTPQRDAGIPQFVTDTRNWADRVQQFLDQHADPPRYLTRTLQRYIDDLRLYVASIRPGPATKYDDAAWTDSLVAYGGPLCS